MITHITVEDAAKLISRIAGTNELHTERLDYESEYLPLIDCANKCSTYEDTGLEPEEIFELKARMEGL